MRISTLCYGSHLFSLFLPTHVSKANSSKEWLPERCQCWSTPLYPPAPHFGEGCPTPARLPWLHNALSTVPLPAPSLPAVDPFFRDRACACSKTCTAPERKALPTIRSESEPHTIGFKVQKKVWDLFTESPFDCTCTGWKWQVMSLALERSNWEMGLGRHVSSNSTQHQCSSHSRNTWTCKSLSPAVAIPIQSPRVVFPEVTQHSDKSRQHSAQRWEAGWQSTAPLLLAAGEFYTSTPEACSPCEWLNLPLFFQGQTAVTRLIVINTEKC